jgi:aminopeptidase YwaD
MKLYPNPVENDLNVKLPQSDGTRISYTISNLSGQTISKGNLDKDMVNVSQLTTGMYFLQLKTNDGRKGAKSFIKK